MLKKYANWLLHYPWVIFMLSLAATYCAGQGITNSLLKRDTAFFAAKQIVQSDFKAQQKDIGFDDNILILLSPKNGNVFTAQNIAIAKNLTENLRQTPNAVRVDSLTSFYSVTEQQPDNPLDKILGKTTELNTLDLAQIKHASLTEPLLVHRLVSADSKTLGFNVIMQPADIDNIAGREKIEKAVTFVRKLTSDLTAVNPDMVIQLSGSIMMQKALAESSQSNVGTINPFALVILAGALWLFTHSFASMLATICLISTSLVITAGLTGWLDLSLTTSNLSALYLIVAIAIADAAHFLTAYQKAIATGLPKYGAIQKSLADNFTALLMSHFATGMAFLSFSYNAPEPLQGLGNIATIGVAVTFFLTTIFLPVFIYLLPLDNQATPPQASRL